jgi:hypothetical protein
VSLIGDPTVGGQVRQGHGAEDGERCGYRAPFMKASWSVCPGRGQAAAGRRLRSKQASGRVHGVRVSVVVVGEVRCAEVKAGNGDWRAMLIESTLSAAPKLAKLFHHGQLHPTLPRIVGLVLRTTALTRTDLTTQDTRRAGDTRYSPLHFPTLQHRTTQSPSPNKHIWGQSAHARTLCLQKTPARLFLASSPPMSRLST